MSDQNNPSFAHAFLPGLILGLIIGAVAGAFLPDMMSRPNIKVDPAHAGAASHERDARSTPEIDPETQALIDEANQAAEGNQDGLEESVEEVVDDATEAAEDLIDDAKNTLPSSP
jgi:gas vesicle protein